MLIHYTRSTKVVGVDFADLDASLHHGLPEISNLFPQHLHASVDDVRCFAPPGFNELLHR
jgi:hypothetical protein